jgi:hypothetical protein
MAGKNTIAITSLSPKKLRRNPAKLTAATIRQGRKQGKSSKNPWNVEFSEGRKEKDPPMSDLQIL